MEESEIGRKQCRLVNCAIVMTSDTKRVFGLVNSCDADDASMCIVCPVDPFTFLISRDLVKLHFGPLYYKALHGALVFTSQRLSCLQGKLILTVHSLCGHILWARTASDGKLLCVEPVAFPPAGFQPWSYKLIRTWRLYSSNTSLKDSTSSLRSASNSWSIWKGSTYSSWIIENRE